MMADRGKLDSSSFNWINRNDTRAQEQVSPSVPTSGFEIVLINWRSTWTQGTDLEVLKAEDPGLAIAAGIPVHRLGTPEEVANIVVMLVSAKPFRLSLSEEP